MSKFGDRLKRLLDLADNPIPGDRVRVVGRPVKKDLVGKTGRVVSLHPDAIVEIEGKHVHLTFNSLKIIEDE